MSEFSDSFGSPKIYSSSSMSESSSSTVEYWENCPTTCTHSIIGITAGEPWVSGPCTGCLSYNTTDTLKISGSIDCPDCYLAWNPNNLTIIPAYPWPCYGTHMGLRKFVCINRVPESSPGANNGYVQMWSGIGFGCTHTPPPKPGSLPVSVWYSYSVGYSVTVYGNGKLEKGRTYTLLPSTTVDHPCCGIDSSRIEVTV